MISLPALTFIRLLLFYSDTHVRLTGHNVTYAGRVEVFSHGIWGRVLHIFKTWGQKEAAVVCRQLGFPGVITALSYSAFGEGSGPVMMSDVQCVGTEIALQQCQYRDWLVKGSFGGGEVGVICKTHDFHPDNSDIPIRLQGSSVPNAGRIEVLYAGVWGAISGDNWDMNDAIVVCRQLGYPAGAEAALKTVVYGLVKGPVWLTNLQCTGSESNVMRCAHDVIGSKTELHKPYPVAGVICKDLSLPSVMTLRLRGSHSPDMKRVEVHYAGSWGSITNYNWDINDATVACRQLGYSRASFSGYRQVCSDAVPPWFWKFQCTGNETSLDQCARDFYTSASIPYSPYFGYCANVVCTNKLTDAGFELRLRSNVVSHSGIVELRFKDVWGTISVDELSRQVLTPETTRVICRQLGFTDGIFPFGSSRFGLVTGPQWFSGYSLRCLGNESNLMNCILSNQPQLKIENHNLDLCVVCKPNVPQPEGFQVRLTGSSLPFAGTVEVLYYGVWGGVLGSGNFDIRVGHVVCRQLGYSGADRIFNRAAFGGVKGPLWIKSIHCNGNETQISQCAVKTWDKIQYHEQRDQQPGNAAAVLCSGANSSDSKDLNMRLAGAPISNAGRVEVYYAGVWGTISSSYWDINDAHVVCRQLGYPGAISHGWSNQFGAGTGPIWFQNVRCLGNESTFNECSKDVYGYPNTPSVLVATTLCKLQYQKGSIQNCSDVKCASNGTCIDTAVGAICNCTEGLTGSYCEIPTFDLCKSSPCSNGGQCFSSGSSYLCICPKGLTGQHCQERIVLAIDPCQSLPCPNNAFCYDNKTHYFCVPSEKENSSRDTVKSTPTKGKAASTIDPVIVIAVAAPLILVLVAAVVCLSFKNRRLTTKLTKQTEDPRVVFSNEAFRDDCGNEREREVTDNSNDVDIVAATIYDDTVLEPEPVYEEFSRPLPPLPPAPNTGTEVKRAAIRPANGNYGDVAAAKHARRHYMGLSGGNGNNAKENVTEPKNYVPLSSERPEAGSYYALNSTGAKTPGTRQLGNNAKKRQQSGEMYENTRK